MLFQYLMINKNNGLVLLIIVALITIYFLRPLKKTFELFPHSFIKNQLAFRCDTIAGMTMFPQNDLNKSTFKKIDAEIFKGGSKIGLEIEGERLKFLTDTSAGAGIIKPAEFTIIKNNKDELQALLVEDSGLLDPGLNTFILNKTTGTAVWMKSKPSLLYLNMPDAQAYYLSCN